MKEKQDFKHFDEEKSKIKNTVGFMLWLHQLTVVGYNRDIMISTEHEDAIIGIYVMKGESDIEKCFDLYENFKKRWNALNVKHITKKNNKNKNN